MRETWLLPNMVFDGEKILKNRCLRVIDGKIDKVLSADKARADARKIDGIVSPGFIDLQVNGGGGVLFNEMSSIDGISIISQAHRQFGTTGILPTVITDAPHVLCNAVDAIIAAKGNPGILGIHIEGPHISVARRGTHSKQFVRPMDEATFSHVERLRSNQIAVLITVAPEAITLDQINRLVNIGAVVSLGHSNASAEETKTAIEAGASCATHLFNAMSPMLNRAPGVTGAVINSSLYAGIIVDGIHVADEMVGLAMRARPMMDTTFLVSDAMPTVGGPDKFNLYGAELHLEEGRLVNGEGSLAGAHLTQAEGVYRLANIVGVDRVEALRAAITIPARVINAQDACRIEGQSLGDVILLAPDLRFKGFLKSE
ncbi:N-acetylglucosamine-6-phosphate deacetylase [Pseudopelagicola sp. nBUS_19]|uniref:N-acetylglucosamine-6-phosphate deacetylase n=1 Tax=unclassified Pseudopelagicola TaxID=2649563 RepID=UPI003EBA2DF4